MIVDFVQDASLTLDPLTAYPTVAAERWKPYRELLDESGNVVFLFGAHLLRGLGHVVLVDAGVGPAPQEPIEGGHLIDSLAALGVAPSDVTDVIFTHLHFDHIGWSTIGNEVVFEHAQYHVHKEAWEHAMRGEAPLPFEGEEDRPIRRLAPLRDRVALWESDGEILDGISARLASGHCPGHCMFEVSTDESTIALLGDVAHHVVELIEPGWPGIGDTQVDLARSTASRLAAELAQRSLPFATAHFRPSVFGRLHKHNGRRVWKAA